MSAQPASTALQHVVRPEEVPGALVEAGAEPVVRATALEKYFGANHVLRGCSMTVYPGETIAILGRSGSGKSTFLRCMNFLEEPSAGMVDIDGIVCAACEAERVRAIVGTDRLIVTPGIRPAGAAAGDQKRVVTPADAIRAGVDHIVVGRPITGAADPKRAAEEIVREMTAGVS